MNYEHGVGAMRLAVETPEEELDGANGCLIMVHEVLEHYLDMDGTSAMFYPEAIQSLVYRAFRAGVAAVYRRQGLIPSERVYDTLNRSATAILHHQRDGLNSFHRKPWQAMPRMLWDGDYGNPIGGAKPATLALTSVAGEE